MVVVNANNWHWVDKNCIDWAQTYFSNNLTSLTAATTTGNESVKITSIDKLKGDVEVCQRKGKLISLFDLVLNINFETDEKEKGSINVPEIAYDTEPDEYQFQINFNNQSSTKNDLYRSLIKEKLIPQLREKLSMFGTDLITSQGSDILIDNDQVTSKYTAELTSQSIKSQNQKPVVKSKTTLNKSSSSTTTSTTKSKTGDKTTSFKLNPSTFQTTQEQLFDTLTQPQYVSMWTRSKAEIQPVENTPFKLLDGLITGTITKLKPVETVEMNWRLSNWKENQYLKLKMNLSKGSDGGETILNVSFEDCPSDDEGIVRGRWEDWLFGIRFSFGGIV
ncbi:hypothetical protein CANARDRAFT_5932 [[Candida] arabinofermentans NRRL YB-2248]|uniref:Activator of Hsp90 ATPase AHSA1-like N-terminal domain-containing protein n=1 Tax=[Candida] arabinofermentans NRRL YB-2248 TaxID=983967 RepID=A0A1E4T6L7_9ASCO|nr:hypothetical protein CANARDRAFT_5932 [[Candida] arabinofermentans NRRL YB-2248]